MHAETRRRLLQDAEQLCLTWPEYGPVAWERVARGTWDRWPEARGRQPEVTIVSPLLCGKEGEG